MEYKDYYQILGVPRTASQAEIKKAFRKLARQHHPDVNTGDAAAEQRFKDVNEAHAVLSDADKRKRYDTLGANWEAFSRSGGAGAPFGQGTPFGQGGRTPFEGFAWGAEPGGGNVRYEFRTSGDAGGFSDFFRMFFAGGEPEPGGGGRGRTATATGNLDDILAGLGVDTDGGRARGTRTRGRTASHGAPAAPAAEATAELSLEEAYHGTTRIVEVDGKRLEVTIPKGVDTGRRIRLSGRGGGGRDLIVVCRVRPHPTFTRRGVDLERELALTLEEALLGAEVPVGTLKGRVLLTIPPGTQNGRTFRLTGQGMPRFNAPGFGDLYVRTRVVLPANLSDDASASAREFLRHVQQPNPRTEA